MPPRHAYWTILIGQAPTAFRAREAEELRPTFERLREKHPDAVMKWFARGRLWNSPEESRDAGRPTAPPEARPRDWRPGGTHRDPRDRFKKPRSMHPARAKKRQTAKPGFEHDTRRDRGRPPDETRAGGRPRDARFGTASPERKRSPTGDTRPPRRDAAQFGNRKPAGKPDWRGAPRRDERRVHEHQRDERRPREHQRDERRPHEHPRDRRGATGRSPHPRGSVKPGPAADRRDARPRGPGDRRDKPQGGSPGHRWSSPPRSDRRPPSGPRPDRPRREWQRPSEPPVDAPRDEREERKRNADGTRLVKKVRR